MSGAEENTDTVPAADTADDGRGATPNLLGSVAVLDACVLYPASLRDLFVTLAVAGLYLPKWTDTMVRRLADQ